MLLHSANQRVFLKVGVLIKKEMFIKIKNFSSLDKSLYCIYQNNQRNVTILRYARVLFGFWSGFEQVFNNGIPVFYVLDAAGVLHVLFFLVKIGNIKLTIYCHTVRSI